MDDYNSLTVLIVDDNRHMRLLLKNILHALGFRAIYEAHNGTDALKIMKTTWVDVVLMDISMPVLDGIEVTQIIRKDSAIRNSDVPIIMISGYSEQFRVHKAIDNGANDFIVKPVSAKTVMQHLKWVLKDIS